MKKIATLLAALMLMTSAPVSYALEPAAAMLGQAPLPPLAANPLL